MKSPETSASWLAPSVEAITAITTSAAPIENKLRSACAALGEHMGALAVWLISDQASWISPVLALPNAEGSTGLAVLGFDAQDGELDALSKSRTATMRKRYAQLVLQLHRTAGRAKSSTSAHQDTQFAFEADRYTLVSCPLVTRGKGLGILVTLFPEGQTLSLENVNQMRIPSRILAMAIAASASDAPSVESVESVDIELPGLEHKRLNALASALPGSSFVFSRQGQLKRVIEGAAPAAHVVRLPRAQGAGSDAVASSRTQEGEEVQWEMSFQTPDQRQAHESALSLALTGVSSKVQIQLAGPDQTRVFEHSFEPVRSSRGALVEVIGFVQDVTDLLQIKDSLREMRERDPITGCLTMSSLREKAPEHLAGATSRSMQTLFVSIDIDRPGASLHLFGNAEHEALVMAITSRVIDLLPEGSLLARRGECNFVAVCGVKYNGAGPAIERLAEGLKNSVMSGRVQHLLAASIGYSSNASGTERIEEMLSYADIAAIHARRMGRSQACAFSKEMAQDVVDRSRIELKLRQAVDREEFSLMYQPKVCLKDGSVQGVEALIRWDEKNAAGPATFIPIAEECGLIAYIGEWVLREACRTAKRWSDAGMRLPISVNVSTRQFHESDFPAVVAEILQETGCEPALIELEVTEGVMFTDPSAAILSFSALKDMGLGLSIDDFGTGFSSLSYLKNLPADAVKIDRTFVGNMPNEPDNLAITQAIITVAKAMKMRVVAEGVEDFDCLQLLRKIGCDDVQGYYFSRPLTEANFRSWYQAYVALAA